MAPRRPRGRSIPVCPQCGSERLVYNSGLITGQVYHCLACDYVGSLVLERDLPIDAPTNRPKRPRAP